MVEDTFLLPREVREIEQADEADTRKAQMYSTIRTRGEKAAYLTEARAEAERGVGVAPPHSLSPFPLGWGWAGDPRLRKCRR